jgi:uncharacterized protein (TIGR02117 family)
MTYLLKPLKFLKFSFLFLFSFLAIYILIALIASYITINGDKNSKNELDIYIKTNGVHTDIVLPIKTKSIDWSEQILFENTVSKDTTFKYVAMGWGDRGFYLDTPTWTDLKFSTALKASIGLSKTALHTTFYKKIVENDRCIKIPISYSQYEKLIEYIHNSFDKNSNNQFIKIKTNANYGINDAFYEAKGSYSLFKTCNTWANNGLKHAGLKHALWTPTDYGIFIHYRK